MRLLIATFISIIVSFSVSLYGQCNGGTLTGGPFTFCVDDGNPDVPNISLTGNDGISQWIVTDDLDYILLLPMSSNIDLEGTSAGTCKVIHLSYDPGITGLIIGSNLSDITGCFDFSNDIEIERLTGVACLGIVTPIPTMGEWGIFSLLILLLILSIGAIRQYEFRTPFEKGSL